MIKFGFFNAAEGTTDREYNAEDFNKCLDAIAGDGVFSRYGGALTVGYNTGMSVQVLDGFARFNTYWIENDAFMNLDIAAASTQYARVDTVVVRVNISARTVEIAVKTGTPAAEPVAPELVRTDAVCEYCLARITIPANTTQITQDMITDTRGNASVCGWIKCGKLVRYQSAITITSATTTVSINIPEYEKGDILDVYRDGVLETAYTDNGDGTITFANAISSGTLICRIIKNTF